ncbi:MAG TPA: glycoside hydrolase family 18 protein [Terriglobales bacterium]|jgi:chitinase|nr:glycoside hydrolase family 18 protein [Terriglobales bacterium]
MTYCSRWFLLLLISSLSIPVLAQNHRHEPRKRLVADYTSGSKYLNPPYGVDQIPFHKLTHIIHAGIPWGPDGTLSVPDGFVEPRLIKRAHAAGVKVMLLAGGDFADAEADPAVLETAVGNIRDFVVKNHYDGVDIDWEFPETDEDITFFVTLMTKLREALPSPRYTLSLDIAPWNVDFYDLAHLKTQIDFFNLMVYDCAGPWTSQFHFNSPIFWDPRDTNTDECEPGASVKEAIDLYSQSVPLKQLNMGTPFYGYDYTNVTGLFGICPNASSTDDGFCDDTVQAYNYGPYIKKLINRKGWVRHYDETSLVPYLVRKDGSPGIITYDDEFSTYARVYYADWIRGLGGSFMWALDADYDGHSQDLLDAMSRATRKHR